MENMEDITICIDDQYALLEEKRNYPNCEHMSEEITYPNVDIAEWRAKYGDKQSVTSVEYHKGRRIETIISIEDVHCGVFYILKYQVRKYYDRHVTVMHIVDNINLKKIYINGPVTYKLYRINDQQPATKRRRF